MFEASSQAVQHGCSCDTTSTRQGFFFCGLTSLLPRVVFLVFLSVPGLSAPGCDVPPPDPLSRIARRYRPGGASPVLIGLAGKAGVGGLGLLWAFFLVDVTPCCVYR